MLYEFQQSHDGVEATKKIYVEGEGAVDNSTVIRCLKEFCSVCKNSDDQARLGCP